MGVGEAGAVDFHGTLLDTAAAVAGTLHHTDIAEELGDPDCVLFEDDLVLGHVVRHLAFGELVKPGGFGGVGVFGVVVPGDDLFA